ncbi:MAG: hypothetical protein JWL73_3172 [Actinomycetia bacterium]|nr:hypothetical protein [Actinomycetes bacterium]
MPDQDPDSVDDDVFEGADDDIDPRVDGEEVVWEGTVDRLKRTTAGAMIGAGLLGLQNALEGRPEREDPAIVTEAPTKPDGPVNVALDFDHPELSKVVIKRKAPPGE